MSTRPPEPKSPPPSSVTATSSPAFVETLEYRRFTEFCDACRRYRYIGLCYGSPGIGKTLSAMRYSRSESLASMETLSGEPSDVEPLDTVFYTPSVANSPARVQESLNQACARVNATAKARVRRETQEILDAIRRRDDAARNAWRDRPSNDFSAPPDERPSFIEMLDRCKAKESAIGDSATLIVIDEADRLRLDSLEQVRDRFDRGGIGLILIGMPGIEKRLARYPQFYSRIGFVHEFRALATLDLRDLLERGWVPPGVELPKTGLSEDAISAIIRMTGGNFRLLNRLLTQIERILEINALGDVTVAVVQAARESLVIGQ